MRSLPGNRKLATIAFALMGIIAPISIIAQEPDQTNPPKIAGPIPEGGFTLPTFPPPSTPGPSLPNFPPPHERHPAEQPLTLKVNPVPVVSVPFAVMAGTEHTVVASACYLIDGSHLAKGVELRPITISSPDASIDTQSDNDRITSGGDTGDPHPPEGAMPPPLPEGGYNIPSPPTGPPPASRPPVARPAIIPTQEELDAAYQRGIEQKERERAEWEAERNRPQPPPEPYARSHFEGRFPGAIVIDDVYTPNEGENVFTHKVVLQTRGGLRLVLIESSILRDPETGEELILSESAVVANELMVKKQPEASLEEFTDFINAQGGTIERRIGRRGNYLVTVEYAGPDTLSDASARFKSNPELVLDGEYSHIGFTTTSIGSPVQIITSTGIIITPDTTRTLESNFDVQAGTASITGEGNTSYLWEDGQDLGIGDGWMGLDWFGSFSDAHYPWIWHEAHGWWFSDATSTTSLWFWDLEMGWIATSEDSYPAIWRHRDRVWLLLEYDQATDGRDFFNSATEQMEFIPFSLEGEAPTGTPPDTP